MAFSQTTSQFLVAELKATLAQIQPVSLMYCSSEQVPALQVLEKNLDHVEFIQHYSKVDTLTRSELGVVFDVLNEWPLSEGIQLLASLRNQKCSKLWVAVFTDENWNFNTMISLGFHRAKSFSENGKELCTYTYDIASYNKKREWNNPKNWANPENWGKYRW